MPDQPTHQEILQRFQELRQEVQRQWSKITELEHEGQEHQMVVKALEPLDPKRRCFRLIGGVLVERTVAEVVPAVKSNLEQLQLVISRLQEQATAKQKELTDFQGKYKIRIKGEEDETPSPDKKPEAPSASQGVLVS